MELLAAFYFVQRRLGNIDEAAVNERSEVAKEEREKKRSDVRAVHIRIGRDDDFVIAQFTHIKTLRDAGAERNHERFDFGESKNLVQSRALYIEHLAAKWQYRLRAPVASHLGTSSGRIAFHQKHLSFFRIFRLAVGKFPGERHALQRAFAEHRVLGGLRGLAGLKCEHHLIHHRARVVGMLFQKGRECLAKNRRDSRLRFHTPEFGLGLSLKLNLAELHRNDSCESFQHILAGEVLLAFLDVLILARIGVQCSSERGFKTS